MASDCHSGGTGNAVWYHRHRGFESRPLLALPPIERLFPNPDGKAVSVRMIDVRGVERALNAGAGRNSRELEWGFRCKLISGALSQGVFVILYAANGRPPGLSFSAAPSAMTTIRCRAPGFTGDALHRRSESSFDFCHCEYDRACL